VHVDPAPGLPTLRAGGHIVVIGVDGGASGRHALDAARQAGDSGLLGVDALLLGVHVQAPPPAWWACPFIGPAAAPAITFDPAWRDELELDAFCDTATALGGGLLPWRFAVDFGDVAATLARYRLARATRLLVVGQRLTVPARPHRWWHRCPARRLAAASGAQLAPVYVVPWAASAVDAATVPPDPPGA
jgi:hypothetical protein